ncbi:MAG: hypothetical protein HY849_08175 [Nitrosomonadales bacterium]|nr:hypothetical protein [Nitrosomonadales bacterium]
MSAPHLKDGDESVPPDYLRQAGNEDDEIDLLELWKTTLKYQRFILGATLGCVVVAVVVSLLMPNIYKAEVLLAAAKTEDAKSGALASLGGLASMAGISVGGSGGGVEENLAVLKSREFLWKFAEEQKILPILFEDAWDEEKKDWKKSDPQERPGVLHVYRAFNEGMLDVEKDKKTDLVTLSVQWKDAELAAEWANALVTQLNQYLAQQAIERSENNLRYLNEELARTQVGDMRKTLFDLIAVEQKNAMLANTQKEFAFKVLDRAVVPDKKIKPKRALIVFLSALIGGFLAIIYILVRESIAKRKVVLGG